MAIHLKGDQYLEDIPSTQSKALRINLNKHIYGTFSEIGAGQETVRHFFRAGGASGTIAKALSAYDKSFSDAIYGPENDGRYVSEARLKKMLSLEIRLLEERLSRNIHPDKLFFAYANTVTTIDFAKRYKGHGWVGIRFQTEPDGAYNDIILHIRFKQNDARSQQETLGVLGLNLIYGAFYKSDRPQKILKYLYDHIDKDALEIDMINFSGPLYEKLDNRLMSLELIRNQMTEAVMFGPDGTNLLPAEEFYKKNILTIRGKFRPVTKLNIEMVEQSMQMFLQEKGVKPERTIVIFELTLSNLSEQGFVDEIDFMDRVRILCSLGYKVLISNFKEYYRLAEYFTNYTKEQFGLVMGASTLSAVFNEEYYTNLGGGILESLGKLFFKDVKLYIYPSYDAHSKQITTSENLQVAPRIKELYKFFQFNEKVVDITTYSPQLLGVSSEEVLRKIKENDPSWQEMVPEQVARTIMANQYFGYNTTT